jgi:hypothetical protein
LLFVVSPSHVLFAAHCLQDKKEKWIKEASESYFIFKNDYDDVDLETSRAKADVSEFIVHPDWNPQDSHYSADIAIAVLKKPMSTKRSRQVSWNTPSDPIQNFAGKTAKVYGWGLTEDHEIDTKLREVSVPLVDQALCNSSHSDLPKIMSGTSFCAGARDGRTGASNGNGLNLKKFKGRYEMPQKHT